MIGALALALLLPSDAFEPPPQNALATPSPIAAPVAAPIGIGVAEEPAGPMRSWALAILALGGAAALVLVARRKRGAAIDGDRIRVLSSQSVGAKARLVLVSVQDRTLLLSVGDQGAQLIVEMDGEGPTAEAEAAVAKVEPTHQSPAISGILALKHKNSLFSRKYGLELGGEQ